MVWKNKTSVKGEGKGSRVGNQEGGPTKLPRPVLILPPQPGGHPSKQHQGGGRPVLILPHQPGRSPNSQKFLETEE